ncbi:MAG: 16S rRNA (cytidine(1402)-2'-O)-methyltransferase [Leptospirales bacterium]|nr:16S rRNA (cytidine(1402)-2'-O)-methyltransferase [Leptospirales bacterium]
MQAGQLYIVAAPIGNTEDITLRALRVLKEEVALIYCEDTRHTGKLLAAHNIPLKMRSLHAHSSDERIAEACAAILAGKNIAYLTDAGTPGLSDPGSRLVAQARSAGIRVVPLPGPSALTALVSVSGFPEKNVFFAGFLSKKPGKRIHELEKLREFPGIIVLYESPHRVQKLLAAINEVFPENQLIIGREMSKRFEEFITGTASELSQKTDSITEKGEFSLAIYNPKPPKLLRISSEELRQK